ncbi:3-oxoacyl-[acyl-carrier protein] reductase [Variovorax sp. HW608]|uniref:SDR family NAD(P)-dependent oxidoreductase n=1 Tax=Variovorax sp. HW608 TaxID=1034889 RepID=UPI00081FEEB7|nr:SDR family oxidoreductase [Variovorax sp. HW608]SCK25078.1 3-oxoacyl-[acyl-carrier protein] reductase [Variovorax sp. HW608]
MTTALPLAGRTALVTGGAGGLGAAICRALAEAGASVAVGYNRSAEAAQALAASLPRLGGARHLAVAAPVTDSASLAGTASVMGAEYGRCDILVNCAGTTRFVPHAELDALDDALFDEVLATNVRGPFAMVRAMLPLLRAASVPGLVVNISSIAAVTAMGSNVAYCASKAALDNMTRSLARALAPQVRVVSVSPGLADTEFVKSMDPDWRDLQAERTPLRRLANPEEVALAVLACATHLPFTTGAVLPVDGGRPLV